MNNCSDKETAAAEFLKRNRGIKQELGELRNRKARMMKEFALDDDSELIRTLSKQIVHAENTLISIATAISLIDDVRLRQILNAYYVDSMTLETISEMLNVSRRHAQRLYKQALQAFTVSYAQHIFKQNQTAV